jgi:hypothetical protein
MGRWHRGPLAHGGGRDNRRRSNPTNAGISVAGPCLCRPWTRRHRRTPHRAEHVSPEIVVPVDPCISRHGPRCEGCAAHRWTTATSLAVDVRPPSSPQIRGSGDVPFVLIRRPPSKALRAKTVVITSMARMPQSCESVLTSGYSTRRASWACRVWQSCRSGGTGQECPWLDLYGIESLQEEACK